MSTSNDKTTSTDNLNFLVIVDATKPLPKKKRGRPRKNPEVIKISRPRTKIVATNEELCEIIKATGDINAKRDLCIKNKHLVNKYAFFYAQRGDHCLTTDDLSQIGMIGMLRAAETYDPDLGTKFTTYAVYWIKNLIVREIYYCGYMIRLPFNLYEKFSRLSQVTRSLIYMLKRNPTIEEIADRFMFNERLYTSQRLTNSFNRPPTRRELDLAMSRRIFHNTGGGVNYVRFLRNTQLLSHDYVSLEALYEENDDEIAEKEFIREEDYQFEDDVINASLRGEMNRVIGMLRPRYAAIIKLRYGFVDGREHTLEEIGKSLGLTRERIRQIESECLQKLRFFARIYRLDEYLRDF